MCLCVQDVYATLEQTRLGKRIHRSTSQRNTLDCRNYLFERADRRLCSSIPDFETVTEQAFGAMVSLLKNDSKTRMVTDFKTPA
jgi:hypothetical protein